MFPVLLPTHPPMCSFKDANANFIFLQHLLLSVTLIQTEHALFFSPDQIVNRGVYYVFTVCLPQAAVIVLHKSKVMNICTGLKALPSGSGFSFRGCETFWSYFSVHTLCTVIFLPLQFNFSTHTRCLLRTVSALMLSCWHCELQIEGSERRLCSF